MHLGDIDRDRTPRAWRVQGAVYPGQGEISDPQRGVLTAQVRAGTDSPGRAPGAHRRVKSQHRFLPGDVLPGFPVDQPQHPVRIAAGRLPAHLAQDPGHGLALTPGVHLAEHRPSPRPGLDEIRVHSTPRLSRSPGRSSAYPMPSRFCVTRIRGCRSSLHCAMYGTTSGAPPRRARRRRRCRRLAGHLRPHRGSPR